MQSLIEKNLDLRQFSYEIAFTKYAKHGIEITKNAVLNGISIIVAVGGDGSVNDIVNGIIGSETTLAIIPKGSGNGLSRSLNIPMNTKKAIQLINAGKIVKIDAGKINGHLFVSNAGVGFDSLVIDKFTNSKQRGFRAYSKIITQHILAYKPLHFLIDIDGKKMKEQAFMLTIANGIQLGYGFKIAPLANVQDGIFDIVILKKFPKVLALSIALKAFTGKIHKSKFTIHLKGKHIKIEHPNLTHFQFDGEAQVCNQSVEIEMVPNSINVLVPQ